MLKNHTFSKSCREDSEYISSFEELLQGKVLFLLQLETISQVWRDNLKCCLIFLWTPTMWLLIWTEIITGHVAAEQAFKIRGFLCKCFLPSSPPVPYFAHAPIFPLPKSPNHLSLIFLHSETPQKHLLRRLVVSRLFKTLPSTSSILRCIVSRSKQNWFITPPLIVQYTTILRRGGE